MSTSFSREKEKKSETSRALTVVKRNGSLVPFHGQRIADAIELAFRDTKKLSPDTPLPSDVTDDVKKISDLVIKEAELVATKGTSLTVEGIQDLVEVTLMKNDFCDVARDYIIYRDNHKKKRQDSIHNVRVLRSDGSQARFNPIKVASVLEETFRRTMPAQENLSDEVIEAVNHVTQKIVTFALEINQEGKTVTTEMLDDAIEKELMREGYFNAAKAFILHRAVHGIQSAPKPQVKEEEKGKSFTITKADGKEGKLTEKSIRQTLKYACRGLEDLTSAKELYELTTRNFYDGIKESEVDLSNIMAARAKIEHEPAYSKVAARLLLDALYRETMGVAASHSDLETKHRAYFKKYLEHGSKIERVNPELLTFDLEKLGKAMDLKRDDNFTYLGLQTLYDRYFIHEEERRLETPQIFWMRVAMGLALKEGDVKNEKAIEFYNTLSTFHFMSSTPTLFNSGTMHSQLSSCYLLTVQDDLHDIFKIVADDAQLSKWAGGLGNDWTNVRATGSLIKGTNGRSQGVIPFLKVANDTAVAVNQGGKRKGAMCAYLETWHLDIEDFLELRKNTGDERRRTHDMNTANWIPDLFMKRVKENKPWTLFSPANTPDLHDLYGKAFEKRYEEYEKMVEEGKLKLFKKVEAVDLWRKMLSMLFETGHPWITFKDPSNLRSPQDHKGVVHSSNLCTEILLNTSKEETAVCNLGSINLAEHFSENGLDEKKLAKTVRTAVRMLDNVIDINFYPIKEAGTSNMRHRPIGLGLMGFQDVLYIANISYADPKAVELADEIMETISYYAILASSELAKEKGTYESYKGSKWDRGYLPIDTLDFVEQARGSAYLKIDRTMRKDWTPVREHIKKHGMRNSNTMAIAPTATISNITGVTQSIEPMYKHLFVKSNLSGEFTIPNTYLVEALKKENLWDDEMLDDLKYFDGSIMEIERIPDSIKQVYATAFEIDSDWLIECAARRQKWIDMGQSLNLYLAEPSGKKLNNMYMNAWEKGLKTTYYLRSVAATQIEKSTTDINKRGLQPRWMKNKSASAEIEVARETPKVCNLEEGCESCQ